MWKSFQAAGQLNELDPFSVNDSLKAHGVLMLRLVDEEIIVVSESGRMTKYRKKQELNLEKTTLKSY
jgi:hypothetical protein